MQLSDSVKIIIIAIIFMSVIYLFVQSNSDNTIHNEGSLKQDVDIDKYDDNSVGEESDVSEELESKFMAKFKTRNSAPDDSFSYSNYADGKRGAKSRDLNKFFEEGHPFDNKYIADGEYAMYVPGKQRKLKGSEKERDKFDVEKMLPQESNDAWHHDDPYKGTSVKNAHLINVHKPLGINTVSTTLKNPSHDIRGTVPNPKYVVSPWANSSWEPDTNLNSQGLCN